MFKFNREKLEEARARGSAMADRCVHWGGEDVHVFTSEPFHLEVLASGEDSGGSGGGRIDDDTVVVLQLGAFVESCTLDVCVGEGSRHYPCHERNKGRFQLSKVCVLPREDDAIAGARRFCACRRGGCGDAGTGAGMGAGAGAGGGGGAGMGGGGVCFCASNGIGCWWEAPGVGCGCGATSRCVNPSGIAGGEGGGGGDDGDVYNADANYRYNADKVDMYRRKVLRQVRRAEAEGKTG